MNKLSLLALACLSLSATACTQAPEDPEPGPPEAAFLDPWTAPRLKWILHAQPGVARLARLDPATRQVSPLVTHTFATHWRPVSVAGNKLLWQRTDTGEVALWTIDQNGNFVRTIGVTLPAAGYRAVSIALEDDGACPARILSARHYVIAFEGPVQSSLGTLREGPTTLVTVDDAGARLGSESLPGAADLFSSLRDFRPARDGRWALLSTSSSALGGATHAVTYYEKLGGVWYRLRTDRYTAAAGLTGCTLHPDGIGVTSCSSNVNDRAPGAGYDATSFQLAQDTSSNAFANTLLWTKADGTSAVFALDPLGQQTSAPTPLTPTAAAFPAVSLGAADGSPGFPYLCQLTPPPPPF